MQTAKTCKYIPQTQDLLFLQQHTHTSYPKRKENTTSAEDDEKMITRSPRFTTCKAPVYKSNNLKEKVKKNYNKLNFV